VNVSAGSVRRSFTGTATPADTRGTASQSAGVKRSGGRLPPNGVPVGQRRTTAAVAASVPSTTATQNQQTTKLPCRSAGGILNKGEAFMSTADINGGVRG
jgi:hypothetical protein